MNKDIIDIPMWEILYSPTPHNSPNNTEINRSPPIKIFNESLKRTFRHIWENEDKSKWMKLIQIFKILDTLHLYNLLHIYNNTTLTRYNKINKYLKNIKGYNEKNCSYFIVALQNYLK